MSVGVDPKGCVLLAISFFFVWLDSASSDHIQNDCQETNIRSYLYAVMTTPGIQDDYTGRRMNNRSLLDSAERMKQV